MTNDHDHAPNDSQHDQAANDERQQELWTHLERTRHTLGQIIENLEAQVPAGNHEEWAAELARTHVSTVTGRPLAQVAAEHGFNAHDLIEQIRGKRVLVIGPGNSTFGSELLAADPSIDLTSVDIEEERLSNQPGKTILASGESLPFDDQTFDTVFMTYSLPVWAMSPVQATRSLGEAARVLAPDGSLHIAPVAQARMRVPVARHDSVPAQEAEPGADLRARIVLCEVDAASIDWLQTVRSDSNFNTTLAWSLPYEGDLGGVMAATITRQV